MRFHQLDGLRGLSSLMIIFYHFEKVYSPDWFYNFFFVRQGQIFVDVFFVMSGFVIALNYQKINSLNFFIKFLKKRFLRLYPLLLFTAIFFLLFFIFRDYLFKNGYSYLFNFKNSQIKNDLLDFVETVFLTNSSPLLGNSIGVNSPSWSISAEILCYVLFGITTLFNKKSFIKILLIVCSSCLLVVLTDNFFQTRNYGFLRGIIGFNSGVLIFCLFKSLTSNQYKILKKFSNILSAVFFVAFITWMYELNRNYLSVTIVTFLTPFIISLLIFSILFFEKGFFLEKKVFRYLGKISYSVYLNHLFILIYLPKFLGLFGLQFNNLGSQLFLMTSIIIITLVISHFTYYKIEKYFYPSINKNPHENIKNA